MRGCLRDPHVALAAAAALVAAAEYGREQVRQIPWSAVEVGVAVVALALVWRRRDSLRFGPVFVVALCLQVGWLVARAHSTLSPDPEWRYVYASQGQELLNGHYPHSEYPTGIVSLFALEAWLGGTKTHFVHAALMVPCQLASVASIWSLRTRTSAWFAAVLAIWPLNAWFWEYRFDLVPTAFLCVGLAFAYRRRWGVSGAALALGTATKWSPALAALALVVYLLTRRETRAAVRATAGYLLTFALVTVPYLVWSPAGVLAAYRRQGGRSITDESVWHLPLQLLGLEHRHGYAHPSFQSVGPPGWADATAIVVQVLGLAVMAAGAAKAPSLGSSIGLAALMPAVFLLTDRVFSVQYFVVLFAAWLLAGALVARTSRDVLAVTGAACASTIANALIVPYPIHAAYAWEAMSAARFALGFALSYVLIRWARAGSPAAAIPCAALTR